MIQTPHTTTVTVEAAISQTTSRVDVRRRTVAVGIGNFMEWFDFAIYGYFATAIGATFFPAGDPGTELLASLAVFAVGFLARPVGALLLGPIGDRHGRRAVLIITVLGMGLSTALMGVIPSYAAIGITAPILLVILRFLQGMMVGGEWSSSATYLCESAPAHRRATEGSSLTITAGAAFLTGTGVAAMLSAVMSPDTLNAWGWRVPFILSLVLAGVAIYIRRKLSDTPVYVEIQSKRAAKTLAVVPVREKIRAFVITFTFSALFGVSLYYFITYANNHLTTVVGMPRPQALLVCSVALTIYLFFHPIIGRISDRIGRRPVILVAGAGLTIFAMPIFLLWNTGNPILVLLGLVVLGALVAMTAVMNVVLMVETFPASIRSSGAAIGQNFALAVLAGPGPLIATALIQTTHNPVSPAYYLAGVALVCTVTLWFMLPETKDKDISIG